MNAPLIRLAVVDDVPLLCRLGAATFRETYRAISDPREVDEYADEHFTPDRVAAWFRKPCAVPSRYRRDSSIALRSATQAAELEAKTIWLGAYDRNVRALAFYARRGFVQVGTHEFEFGGRIYADPVLTRPVAAAP